MNLMILFRQCTVVTAFLQKKPVILDIIYMDNEQKLKDELMAKWKNHNHMEEKMIAIVKKYGLSQAGKAHGLERKMGVEPVEVKKENIIRQFMMTV